jgi:hypothetical protein
MVITCFLTWLTDDESQAVYSEAIIYNDDATIIHHASSPVFQNPSHKWYKRRVPLNLISYKRQGSDTLINRRDKETGLLTSNDFQKPHGHMEDHWLDDHKKNVRLNVVYNPSQQRRLASHDLNRNTENNCIIITGCELCTSEQRENENVCKETGRVQRWKCQDTQGKYHAIENFP